LPGQNSQQFYQLNPLIPFIESGFTLLTPNFRLARRIKAAWDNLQQERGAAVWEPLPVYPLESWLLQRWRDSVCLGLGPDRVLLAEGQALELWQRAIEREQARGQYRLLQDSAAASLAHQARERLLRWQVNLSAPRFSSAFELDEDCAAFLAWNEGFEQYLQADSLATGGDCVTQLLGCAEELPQGPLLLMDFDDIPPLFQACVDGLATRLEYRVGEGLEARCSGSRYSDRRAELAAVASWAQDLSRREPLARIGIVLSDMDGDRFALEYLLRRAFDCLGDNYNSLPVNFSTGITLDRAPVVRDAMAVLRLTLRSVAVSDVTRLLQSRFLDLPDRKSPVAIKLLRRLYDSGRERVEVADLRYLASQLQAGEQQGLSLGRHLMSMTRLRELGESRLPSGWLDPLCAVLDSWGWPGAGPLDSLEHQQVQLWYAALEQLAAYDEVVGRLSLEALLGLMDRLLSSQVSQPQTADSAIQVLGPLEAAGLEFDHLWLCGMQGSRWPAPPRPSPFIPVALQRELQMPHATAEREWAYAEGLMRQYLHGTRELHASYACQLDAIPELPSALLAGFPMIDGDEQGPVDSDWQQACQGRAVEIIGQEWAPVPAEKELEALQGGSALLEDQSQCPFRAFARRRLHAEPLGEAVPGMSAADRGSLMHRALHLLFQAIPDSDTLAATSQDGEAELVRRAVMTALEELPRSGPSAVSPAWIELEGARLETLLSQWLAVERQREAFRVAATEEDLYLRLEALELRLRVDRIDRLPDGSALIIDYKSGACSLGDWLGERPAKPQLLLYGVAGGETPAALGFARLRIDDCAFIGAGEIAAAPGIRTDIAGLVRGGWEIDSWQALNDRWRGQLQDLAREFLAGQARVDPQVGACTWCGLQALCRVNSGVPA
jgi:probable DNA repair protein